MFLMQNYFHKWSRMWNEKICFFFFFSNKELSLCLYTYKAPPKRRFFYNEDTNQAGYASHSLDMWIIAFQCEKMLALFCFSLFGCREKHGGDQREEIFLLMGVERNNFFFCSDCICLFNDQLCVCVYIHAHTFKMVFSHSLYIQIQT